jgi:energy-coupling factor transporter ATP-binding protein EcfA2
MHLKIFSSKNFIGRNNELDALKNIAAEAKSGEASSILLTGSRGIGKTELLRHLYNHLFNYQNDAIPFFYTIRSAFNSLENFSKDYFSSFIINSLAFLRRDPSMVVTGTYMLQDLRDIASETGTQWALNLIDRFVKILECGDSLKTFSFAISAPYQSFISTEIPVVVMIDDYHKIKKISVLNESDGSDVWMLFENLLKSRSTPHIFAGFETELQSMFFEETAFGEQLELVRLPGLNRGYSTILFSSLCDTYGIKAEGDSHDFMNTFHGNPFYIKSFVQAARQAGGTLSEENVWDIYYREVTGGKIFTYWTSILKSYIPHLHLRRSSLTLLNSICSNGIDSITSDAAEHAGVAREEFDEIIGLLLPSGIIKSGFSSFSLVDDQVLIDVIKGLYKCEIEKDSSEKVTEAFKSDKEKLISMIREDEPASFRINVPSKDRAESVVVKGLEHIAEHFNIPPDTTGQMQIALAELFNNILSNKTDDAGKYSVKYNYKENTFSMEIDTFREDVHISEDDAGFIGSYFDDLKVEQLPEGTKITLSKKISKDTVSAG